MNRSVLRVGAALLAGLAMAGCGAGQDKKLDAHSDAALIANKPAGTNAVIVRAVGYGQGTIAISDPSAACVRWEPEDSHYTLVCWAYPTPSTTPTVSVSVAATYPYRFSGWGNGPCAGTTGATCAIQTDRDQVLGVRFDPPGPAAPKSEYSLQVEVLGLVDGEITATASPVPAGGFQWGCTAWDFEDRVKVRRSCSATVPAGTQVTLTAGPQPGTVFAGWGGSCAGTGTCAVTADRDRSVTAWFAAEPAPAAAPRVASFLATPSTITAGEITTLSWSVLDATTVSVDQGAGVVTGSSLLVAPAATTTYTLTATNASGTTTRTVTVTVVPPATGPVACADVAAGTLTLDGISLTNDSHGALGPYEVPLDATTPPVMSAWHVTNHGTRPVANVGFQTYIEQEFLAVRRAGDGPFSLCGAADGEIAPGTCSGPTWYTNVPLASNAAIGSGTLVPGPAVLIAQMGCYSQGVPDAAVLGEVRVPVTLVLVGAAPSVWNQPAAFASHSAAVRSDGSIWGWGSNGRGQIGDGATVDRYVPVPVGTGFTAVSLGFYHGVALRSDGSVWTWGWNGLGTLGTGTFDDSAVPVLVGSGYTAVSAGEGHSLALRADGSLWGWGYNEFGQLGDGTLTNRNAPQLVGVGFASMAAGWHHSAAVAQDGTLWAWGENSYGEVGDGTTSPSLGLVPIGRDYRAVAAGRYFTLALKVDGTIWAWGYGANGQLGDGSVQAHSVPRQVGKDTDWVRVAAGMASAYAIKTDGSLWAWGSNAFAQLGDGTTTQRSAPVPVGGGFREIAAGNSHAVAVRTDGSLVAWGSNAAGNVGDGTTRTRTVPTPVGVFATDPPRPSTLVFEVEPPIVVIAGTLPPIRVAVLDQYGAPFTSGSFPITVGGQLAPYTSGTTTVDSVLGAATFADLRIDPPAGPSSLSVRLTASAPGLDGATSATFAIDRGDVSELNMVLASSGGPTGPIGDVTVTALTPSGAPAALTNPVTIEIWSGPSGGTLAGPTTATAVQGVATFSGLSLDVPGVYLFRASSLGPSYSISCYGGPLTIGGSGP